MKQSNLEISYDQWEFPNTWKSGSKGMSPERFLNFKKWWAVVVRPQITKCLIFISKFALKYNYIMYLQKHLVTFDRDLINLLVIKPVLSLSKSLKYSVNLTFLACTAFLILSSTSLRATGLAKDWKKKNGINMESYQHGTLHTVWIRTYAVK